MKNILYLVFILFSITTSSQETNTALEKVANETCNYFNENKVELEKLTSEDRLVKLGLKTLSLYDKYKVDLKNEGIILDISDDLASEKFGEMVGFSMFKFCPDLLMLLAQDSENDTDEDDTYSISGKLKSIDGVEFATISIIDENGKTQKFIWLNNFVGSDKLINKEFSLEDKVNIIYKNVEIYSPQLKEYIVKKQIFKIEYLP